jgi:hypothetical protein
MIPRDDEFDVYVSECVLLEVWRGQHVTTAQQFASNWDGLPESTTHPLAFNPLPHRETHAGNLMARPEIRTIVRCGTLWLVASIAFGAGLGALLAYVLDHAWR